MGSSGGECAIHKGALCGKCLFPVEERSLSQGSRDGDGKERRFVCRFCNKVCGNGGGLASHEKTHLKEPRTTVVVLDDDGESSEIAGRGKVSEEAPPSSQTHTSASAPTLSV